LRVLLVYNPTAGEDGPDLDELTSLLEGAGHDVASQSVEESDWVTSLRPDIDLVAVAGGDGTVRKVFKLLAGTGRTATLLPEGTANNIARTLGFDDDDPSRLIQDWSEARRWWCDVGSVASAAGDGAFVESAGGGVFADLLAHAEAADGKLAGEAKIEFGLRTLREVVQEAPALEWGVWADGVDLSGEFLAVEARA
jgi:diacylglycerol kinase (ATP)